jgi:hypothetical protein
VRHLLFIGLLGCGPEDAAPAADHTCDTPQLTWENTGDPFVTTWCTGCHSAEVAEAQRFGAPPNINFDTLAEVQLWQDRIRAVALADDAAMPLAGPATAEDRTRMGQWLDCGAPGTEVPDPTLPCDTLTPYVGDLALSSAPDDFCDTYNALQGNLTADAQHPAAGCLCEVTGGMWVSDALSMPLLTTVGGIESTASLQLPLTEVVNGGLWLHDLPEASVVDLGFLHTIRGDFVVENNATLANLNTARVTEIDGDLLLLNNPAYAPVFPFDSLLSVGTVHLEGLGIENMNGLRWVASMDSLVLRLNPHLARLTGLAALEVVDGDLRVESNPLLIELPGPKAISEVHGDLHFIDNLQLSTQLIVDIASSMTVDGAIVIEGNAP